MSKAAMIVGLVALWCSVIAGIWWLFYFLWNTIAADIFGAPELSFWQSVGLLVLVSLLLGGVRASNSK